MLVEFAGPATLALGVLAGGVLGAIGFGSMGCWLLGLAMGLPPIHSFALTKASLFALDAGAALRYLGRPAVRNTVNVQSLLLCASGATLAAWLLLQCAWWTLSGLAVAALARILVLRAKGDAASSGITLAFGLYMGACGIGAGSLYLAWQRRENGVGWMNCIGGARLLGAAANGAAAVVLLALDASSFGALNWLTLLAFAMGSHAGAWLLCHQRGATLGGSKAVEGV